MRQLLIQQFESACILLLHNKQWNKSAANTSFFKIRLGEKAEKNNNTFINLTGLYTHPKGLEVIKKHAMSWFTSNQIFQYWNTNLTILPVWIMTFIPEVCVPPWRPVIVWLSRLAANWLLGFRNEKHVPHGPCCFMMFSWVTLCGTLKTII